MPAWNAFSFMFGPIMAVLILGVLVLALRWTFSRGKSVVAAPAKKGAPSDYGMLVPIASPSNYIEGEIMRRSLEVNGLRATLATTVDGPRIMVWPKDEHTARHILKKV